MPARSARDSRRVAAQPRQLLNSERIAARFGSYGVEVLASDAARFASRTFTARRAENERAARSRSCAIRTAIDPALAAEHAEIVRGGSIGAVFAAHGWRVREDASAYFGDRRAGPRLAALMRVAPGTPARARTPTCSTSLKGGALVRVRAARRDPPSRLPEARRSPAIYGPPMRSGHEPAVCGSDRRGACRRGSAAPAPRPARIESGQAAARRSAARARRGLPGRADTSTAV